MIKRFGLRWLLAGLLLASAEALGNAPWIPAHTVIVVLENRSASQVVGDATMPYFNQLARQGALMTNAYFGRAPYSLPDEHGLPARPSQPNYLYLFAANDQGVLPKWRGGIGNDLIPPARRPFQTPNLGAAIRSTGGSFAGFSESLPYPHYDGAGDLSRESDLYRRKHNPTINWVNLSGAAVPANKVRFVLPVSTNLGLLNTHDPFDKTDYRGFAVDEQGKAIGYERLPTVAFVVPNEQNDAHSNSPALCDAWLVQHIKPYADWARVHNSLLILTFDEDGATDASQGDPTKTGIDRIATVLVGPPAKVRPGKYPERIDHLNVLSTVLDRHGALANFAQDFCAAYGTAEATLQCRNLRPIMDVFGEGPPLAPLGRPAPPPSRE